MLGLQLSGCVADFHKNYAFHDPLHPPVLILPLFKLRHRHSTNYFVVQLLVLGLFGDGGPADRTFIFFKKAVHHTLAAKGMTAVSRNWPKQSVKTDRADVAL